MVVNALAENVLGTVGTILWSGQLIPQIWKSWREHSTAGLSHWLVCVTWLLFWGLAGLFLGVYAIVQDLNIPLIIQPQLFSFLCLFSWGQCLYYGMRKSRLAACVIAGSVMFTIGVLEVGLVFAIRPQMNQRAIEFFGVFASLMLAAGLLPQYWEILERKEVVGISIPFITIDLLGGLFSVLSLLFRPKFDVTAGVAYSVIIVMDGLIVIAAIILSPRARKRRLQAERESVLVDESPQMTESSGAIMPTPPQIGQQSINDHEQTFLGSKED